jgi:hypothetical protein
MAHNDANDALDSIKRAAQRFSKRITDTDDYSDVIDDILSEHETVMTLLIAHIMRELDEAQQLLFIVALENEFAIRYND